MLTKDKYEKRLRRRLRIRKKISGTPERPRLCIYKSLRHLYGQLVDDTTGHTLAFVTTNTKEFKAEGRKTFANIEYAKRLGKKIGEKAVAAGVTKVVFDRSGYPYHGVVKAFADAAREAGLKF
ncbi:MAG: 50S ribosomal protein L18 [Candidatus Hydrogenedentota bacterium]|jgi:large subunit ribosomal protein L18|uniref:Large ribosomal subunit protein uL18 n=1 Tax=Sumerlaea chitinivorans TaxID=2250252 RepID=A0A2Z4Y263_SUMC1|nr:LSU ribosomal protein L18p (L5e) [Candidatus Sumerlaea chitinivorans]RMH25896.1 MAG: 50S ribosomal protein L18 [Candidatus Hydrogenedentota bacterium]GIX45336.1 MAG: 50S ribosomal protein L18 [Candidatus Sumerlaea sp.]